MFCTECGIEYAGNPNFCVSCGARLSGTGVESPQKTVDVAAKCPYCGHTLAKKPMRKTKCPGCERYIYVKSTTAGDTKMLMTEEQAAKIEKEWQCYDEDKELENWLNSDSDYRREYEEVEAKLIAKRRTEPSVGDIRWAVANERLLRYARRGDWGLYRNTKYAMAKQLQVEQKLKEALRTYLEVCYLDANGPCNNTASTPPELRKEYPPFRPRMGFTAPGIIWEVRELNRGLGLQPNEVRSLFLEVAGANPKRLRLPIEPSEGWDMITQTNVFATDEEMEEARLGGSGYDLLEVAQDRRKRLEASGATPEQYDEVLSILEAALTTDITAFTKATVHKHIGEIQHICGRDADAMQHLEAAIRLNRKVGVKRLLEGLRKSQKFPIPSDPDGQRA